MNTTKRKKSENSRYLHKTGNICMEWHWQNEVLNKIYLFKICASWLYPNSLWYSHLRMRLHIRNLQTCWWLQIWDLSIIVLMPQRQTLIQNIVSVFQKSCLIHLPLMAGHDYWLICFHDFSHSLTWLMSLVLASDMFVMVVSSQLALYCTDNMFPTSVWILHTYGQIANRLAGE